MFTRQSLTREEQLLCEDSCFTGIGGNEYEKHCYKVWLLKSSERNVFPSHLNVTVVFVGSG